MPYIKKIFREKFWEIFALFNIRHDLNNLNAGELNYLITKIIDRQLVMIPITQNPALF